MIIVTPAQLQQIRVHAERSYPLECCGLLLGKITSQGSLLIEVRETENSWTDGVGEALSTSSGSQRDRFYIAPEVLLHLHREVRDRQLAIVGVYHSHPDHLAVPSSIDRDLAWSEYSYLIVALAKGQVTDLKCWKLDGQHQFQPEIMSVQHSDD